jgi:DNA polymerase-3 subunit delta
MLKQYLLYGKSQSLIFDEALDLIQSLDIDEEGQSFYDLSEHAFDDIYEDMISPPFFTDKKLIVVKHLEVMYEDAFAKQSLERFLKSSPTDVVLVMMATHIDEDQAFRHVLDLYVEHHEVALYDEPKMMNMIHASFEKDDIFIEKKAVMKLIQRITSIPEQLNTYIDMIKTYGMKEKKVLEKDIDRLVPLPLEDNVFMLVDYFLQHRTNDVLSMYEDLKNKHEDPIKILQFIGRRLNDLEDTKMLLQKNKSQNDIAKELQVSSGKAYYMIKEAKTIPIETIQKYIDQVAHLDFLIKSGRLDKTNGVYLFLLGDLEHA